MPVSVKLQNICQSSFEDNGGNREFINLERLGTIEHNCFMSHALIALECTTGLHLRITAGIKALEKFPKATYIFDYNATKTRVDSEGKNFKISGTVYGPSK